MPDFSLETIQALIAKFNLDAWLFFDFRGSNDLAHRILNITAEKHLTRRFFYLVPKTGTPIKIVNSVEAHNLNHLPGETKVYSSYDSLHEQLKNALANYKNIAMEYSPKCAIPYISKIDAGTIEYLSTFNINILSSADLISSYYTVWNEAQFKENVPVAKALNEIVDNSFKMIKSYILAGRPINEFTVQSFIMDEFEKRDYFTDFPPIVAVNGNAANPHYGPTESVFQPIVKGDLVLIDLWAKPNNDNAVWSDITWVGYVGESVPEKYVKVFNIVAQARDTAFDLVSQRFSNKQEVRGFELDQACRDVIEKAGYGSFFIHRTGHSIDVDLHGNGAHLDNYETRDERLVLPMTSFSIEPGIYLPGDFGIRSEIDVFIKANNEVIATGRKQTELVPILK